MSEANEANEANETALCVTDVWLAAYLIARGGHLGEPIVDGAGQVTFRVVGPAVERDAELFLRGQAVASVHALKSGMQLARDFIAATKRARGGGGGDGAARGRAARSGRFESESESERTGKRHGRSDGARRAQG